MSTNQPTEATPIVEWTFRDRSEWPPGPWDGPEPTVADVLRRGAQRIHEHGWCRWDAADGEAGCGIITICRAGRDLLGMAAPHERVNALTHEVVVTLQRFLDVSTYIGWNEDTALDGEHVAQTFEKAAAAWEETVGL